MAFEHQLSLKRNQAREVDKIRLERNKMNDYIELVPALLYNPSTGAIYTCLYASHRT